MRTFTKLLSLSILAFTLFQCRDDDDEITPVKPDDKDPVNIELGAAHTEKFSIVGEKSNVTDTGYDVKGSLYLETDSGKVAIVEKAAFTVTVDNEGNLKSIDGNSTVTFPDLGMFTSFSFPESVEAAFVYNTGKYFKDTNESFRELPLLDTSYYFFFNLLNLAPGEWEVMSVENANIGVTDFFINLPQQQMIITTGNFEIEIPGGGTFSLGNKLAIGISAKKSFSFTPTVYTDSALNATIDAHQAFSDIKGFLYLAGEISLGDKIPMGLEGKAVIDGDRREIFSKGFDPSSFVFAMNGDLVFGHDLLDLLPIDVNTELTNVTFRAEQIAENGSVTQGGFKFAGEFDDNAWMETIIDGIAGGQVSQYLPLTGNEGSMFASFSDNMDDWGLYVNLDFSLNTPHLGKQKLRRSAFYINSTGLGISGGLALPFVPGEVLASGNFDYDGNLHLRGELKDKLNFEDVKFKSNIVFDIYNDYATLNGEIIVPHGIGTMQVNGKIDKYGLLFNGEVNNRDLDIADGISLPVAELQLFADINESNPKMDLTGEIVFAPLDARIDVEGKFDSNGIELSGEIDNYMYIIDKDRRFMSFPLVDMGFTIRTWQGVTFKGLLQLPFGIGSFETDGYMTARRDMNDFPEIRWYTSFESDPTLKIEGFDFPTANFYVDISSIEGVAFGGAVKMGKVGWANASGMISTDKIYFAASIEEEVEFGDKILYSRLDFAAGNGLYPNIASAAGTIQTPFGQASVSGVVGLNGKFKFTDSWSFCGDFPLVEASASGAKYFTFRETGVALSAKGKICDDNCDSLDGGGCGEVTVGLEVDWNTGKFDVCVDNPIPGVPTICL